MASERLRSIVPMFGGATSYVETLDAISSTSMLNSQRRTNSLAGIEEGLNGSRVEIQS